MRKTLLFVAFCALVCSSARLLIADTSTCCQVGISCGALTCARETRTGGYIVNGHHYSVIYVTTATSTNFNNCYDLGNFADPPIWCGVTGDSQQCGTANAYSDSYCINSIGTVPLYPVGTPQNGIDGVSCDPGQSGATNCNSL